MSINFLPFMPSTFRIVGITRIFEVWKDNEWKQISLVDLENGMYIIRVRYTDEDQKLLDEKK